MLLIVIRSYSRDDVRVRKGETPIVIILYILHYGMLFSLERKLYRNNGVINTKTCGSF